MTLAAVAALLLVVATAATSAPRLEVALTPREITVGDRVEAVLSLDAGTGPLAGAPRFPAWRETWGDAEVLEVEAPEPVGDGERAWRQRLVITAFAPGETELPPVAVAVPGAEGTVEARTPQGLALTVRSVLPQRDDQEGEDAEPQPKPEAPPVPLPLGAPFWWTTAGLSAACLALGLLLVRKRAAVAAAAGPPLDPLPELVRELDRAAAEESAVKAHTRLSLALRRYLGRTLAFRAAESTTSEIHRRLLAHRLPAPLVRRAVELLRGCDLVKFARQEMGPERIAERVAAARAVGEEVERHVHPPEPERLEAAG